MLAKSAMVSFGMTAVLVSVDAQPVKASPSESPMLILAVSGSVIWLVKVMGLARGIGLSKRELILRIGLPKIFSPRQAIKPVAIPPFPLAGGPLNLCGS